MALQRFIRFIAVKADQGSADHESELQDAADQYPEITDAVIAAYIEVTKGGTDDDDPSDAAIEGGDNPPTPPTPPTVALPVEPEVPPNFKWCGYHKAYEPVEKFGIHNHRDGGLQSWCKAAQSEHRKIRTSQLRASRNGNHAAGDLKATTSIAEELPMFRARAIEPSSLPQVGSIKPPIKTKLRRMNEIAPDGFLYCTGCDTFKPDNAFDRDRSKPDRRGRSSRCVTCRRAYEARKREGS